MLLSHVTVELSHKSQVFLWSVLSGVLMLTAWMWTVSTAVFIARHYKHLWPDTTLLGQSLWFQVRAPIYSICYCSIKVFQYIYKKRFSFLSLPLIDVVEL